jgi:putative membrane protein
VRAREAGAARAMHPEIAMRWFAALSTCAMATVAVAQPAGRRLPARDVVVLIAEHHADQRAIALGRLAASNGTTDGVRALGRHVVRDLGFADQQVRSLAQQRDADLASPPDAWDRTAADVREHVASLEGLAFDRAVLAAISDELGRHLAFIDATRGSPHTGDLLTLLATMRPTLARYQAEADFIGRGMRPSA